MQIVRQSGSMNIDPTTNLPKIEDAVRAAVLDNLPFEGLYGPNVLAVDALAAQPVYRRASDGQFALSVATDGTTEADNIVGWMFAGRKAGDLAPIVTENTPFGYSDGTAPKGRPVYLHTVAGMLSTVPAYGTQKPCGYSHDGYIIYLKGLVFQN